ncbi:MAG: mucoidy inhibitor MuiA family protein [Flavobacteriales bacterium]|nr:mucoidy inhibitor MuiA family protein [Flavobacteriales bacterium]
MRHYILTSLFISAACLSSFAQVKEIEINSKVTDVTIFFSGAQVSRTASLQLNPGTNIIRMSRLSYTMDPNSIQVEGSKQYTIVSVNHRHNFLQDADELPEVKSLKDQLEKVNNDIELNRIEMGALNEEKAYVEANKSFIGENKSITVDDMMDMSELYQSTYRELLKQLADLKFKDQALRKESAKITQQLQQLRSSKNLYTSDIIVNISSPARITSELKFKYVTGNAGWTPSYDAKTTDIQSPIALTYKAKVAQSTGEEWKNVKLKLSTGNPSKNNNLPSLAVWQISGYDYEEAERRRKEQERSYSNARKKSSAAYETGAAPSAKEAKSETDEYIVEESDKLTTTAQYTTIAESSVNTEFNISIPYTINGDGQEYTVEIGDIKLDAKYRYFAAPKYDASAFLVGYISGWEKHNLISGMANVYFMDSYVGSSYLNTQSTLDSISLSLGRDKSVIIERKKIKDYSKPSFSGGKKKVTIGIELTVKNTKNAEILLDLQDQYPVSQNKEIEVELMEEAGATVKKEIGGLFWVLNLKPNESKTIRFVYSVKFPQDKDVANF